MKKLLILLLIAPVLGFGQGEQRYADGTATENTINLEHLSIATYIVKATDKSNNEELTYKVLKN
jgi:hypothetical protein